MRTPSSVPPLLSPRRPPPAAVASEVLRVGTWNLSHWTAVKAQVVADEVPTDVLAVQETHLATLPLEWARGTAKRLGLHLYHGHPVPASAQAVYGRSCGVGFVARQGVAVSVVGPAGAAWRRLHAMGRLHGVRLEPRAGLPRGLLLLSVYAPLQVRAQQVLRGQFAAMLLEVTHTLDMQIPTMLMGDFNGSADPIRDFLSDSGRRRQPCPLLAQLLGPGGAWVDVHRTLLGEVPWTFQSTDREGTLSASRIDLVLANHAAMQLVRAASVLGAVRDGGHSPVLVEVRWCGAVGLEWAAPRPRLPELLTLGSAELRQSVAWQEVVERWQGAASVAALRPSAVVHTAASLSRLVVASLQEVVHLAGGWARRPQVRRAAYDSNELQRARRRLADLYALAGGLRRLGHTGPACWPRTVGHLLVRLERTGLSVHRGSAMRMLQEVGVEAAAQRQVVERISRDLRRARHDLAIAVAGPAGGHLLLAACDRGSMGCGPDLG